MKREIGETETSDVKMTASANQLHKTWKQFNAYNDKTLIFCKQVLQVIDKDKQAGE